MVNTRAYAYIKVECHAPDDMFGKWEDVSEQSRWQLENFGHIPCEGVGNPGVWCQECPFAEFKEGSAF